MPETRASSSATEQQANSSPVFDSAAPQQNKLNIKFPVFTPDQIDLYFKIIDSILNTYNLSEQEAFLNSFMTLPGNIHPLCKQLLNQGTVEPMKQFKKIINAHFNVPIEERLKKIFQTTKVSDRKPSEHLRYIRDTLGEDAEMHSSLIKSHFLDSLPPTISPFVRLFAENYDLDSIAAAADKSWPHSNVQISNITQNKPQCNAIDSQIEALTQQINAMSIQKPDVKIEILKNEIEMKLSQLQRQIEQNSELLRDISYSLNRSSRERSYSREKNRNYYRNNSQSRYKDHRNKNSSFCFYHERFGDRSTKCAPPCNFAQKSSPRNPNSGNE